MAGLNTRSYKYAKHIVSNWTTLGSGTCSHTDGLITLRQWYDSTNTITALGTATATLVSTLGNATNALTILGNDFASYYQFIAAPEHWEETAEQKAARLAGEARLQVVAQKADRLLFAHLSDAQRQTFEHAQYFDVVSSRGRTYRIKKFRAGNVYLLDAQGREVRRYCAYAKDPGGTLPDGDFLFTQMVTLQFDEPAFLKMANTWDLLQPGAPFVGQGVDYDAPLQIAEAA